jgi:hypothetical protein
MIYFVINGLVNYEVKRINLQGQFGENGRCVLLGRRKNCWGGILRYKMKTRTETWTINWGIHQHWLRQVESPVTHRGGLILILALSMWNSWWSDWHWNRFFPPLQFSLSAWFRQLSWLVFLIHLIQTLCVTFLAIGVDKQRHCLSSTRTMHII